MDEGISEERQKILEKDKVNVGKTTFDFSDPTEGGVVKVHAASLEKTNIEILNLEKKVFDWIIEGRSKHWILHKLKVMCPDVLFTIKEIDFVMNRNPELTKAIISQDKQLMKKHALINLDYREKLLGLQERLERLADIAEADKEYGSVVAAANTMLKNITLIAKLKGDIDQPSTNVNVNLGEQVAEIIAENKSSLRSKILEKTIDVDVVVDNDTE